jgi:hypothetical protein
MFRDRLISAIAEADSGPEPSAKRGYYENWLLALEELLVTRGILTLDEIEARAQQFASGTRDIVDPAARSGAAKGDESR